ncbi:MAG: alkaline phosphatase family protein [Planctomycetes bacterium]|nr:alkaline phosphatase family protein [Planctomycetota bacterium]
MVLPFACGPTLSPCAEPRAKKVLLIGIDGLRSDALRAAKTPYLDALAASGAMADDTQILPQRYTKGDTTSGPGWSSLLTGVWADKHGVEDNSFRGGRLRRYPDMFTRIETARPAAVTASFVSWKPLDEHLLTSVDHAKFFAVKDKAADKYAQTEWELATAAGAYLQEQNPDAMLVYFGLVDAMVHTKGFSPRVREYLGAIKVVDNCVGRVLRGMAARKTFAQEDWLVIVCTDHGGAGKDHRRGHKNPKIRKVPLIVSGPSAVRGKFAKPTSIVDVPVTALSHLGVAIDPKWKLDGRPVGLKTSDSKDR